MLTLVAVLTSLTVADAQIWVPKISTDLALGYPFAINPLDENVIYAAAGHAYLYRSRNRGQDWEKIGSPVFAVGAIKAIAISPRDTNIFVIGLEILPGADRIIRSTNGGNSWTTTWIGTFNYFGKPFDFKPEHPDTMYTMGNDTLYRTTDFARTWSVVRTVHGMFDLWCDIEIRPDSVNTFFVGDHSSGIWKTSDGGFSWALVYSTTGEIPSIAIDPFRPSHMIAAKYGGGGGLVESNDGGAAWHSLPTPIGSGNAWWVTFSRHDSGYVYFGSYGGSPTGPFLSRDNGSTWSRYWRASPPKDSINAFNYALIANDSLSVLALQADGIYLLAYTPGIEVVRPQKNDYWKAGSTHEIAWRDSNIVAASLSYSTDNGGSWAEIVSGINGKIGHYPWLVPHSPSRFSRIRVTDASNSSIVSVSDTFAIYDTAIVLTAPIGGEAWQGGTQHTIRWRAEVNVPVQVEYSLDKGNSWNAITETGSAVEHYAWIVPDTAAVDCRVRVAVPSDSTLNSIPSEPISIHRCDPVVITLPGSNGWSLISLSVSVMNNAVASLFPYATSQAYSFSAGYQEVTNLELGKGYWIKSGEVQIAGCPIMAETIHVSVGWNIIGSLSDTIMASQITTSPPNLDLSPFYRYSAGYVADTYLVPGNGYWVKSSSDGDILIGSGHSFGTSSSTKHRSEKSGVH